MLATHCAVWRRPLLDAVSVEKGMGPICRRKYGVSRQELSPEEQDRANKLVYEIAKLVSHGLDITRAQLVGEMAQEVKHLGFMELSDIIMRRTVPVRIEQVENLVKVSVPYDPGAVQRFKFIPGHSYDRATKTWSFSAKQRPAIWTILRRVFANHLGHGPKGFFIIQSF